jgi:hypothetical protein
MVQALYCLCPMVSSDSLKILLSVSRKKFIRKGMIPPQAWIKETETELSDSEVLTRPGGFEPVTPKREVSRT